jgi:hypothetical protein
VFGQKGISIAGSLAYRRSLNARLRCIQPKNLIGFAAHYLVAFACHFCEPRSVNLDQAPPIRSDSTRRPELLYNQRHCRSSYSKQLRQRLLRQRYRLVVNSIADVEQPPGHAGLDGVQCIAGGHMLELHQQCPRVGLDRMFDGATLAEGCMKS